MNEEHPMLELMRKHREACGLGEKNSLEAEVERVQYDKAAFDRDVQEVLSYRPKGPGRVTPIGERKPSPASAKNRKRKAVKAARKKNR